MWPSQGVSLPKEMQLLQNRFSAILYTLNSNPKVAQFMETPVGRYLDGHPFFVLVLLVFGAMATVPIGLFMTFAITTFITASIGFVFLEGFLLSLGGIALLCVLCGLAIIAFAVSAILGAFYITATNVLNYYYSQRSSPTKQDPAGSPSRPDPDSSPVSPEPQKPKGQ
uniref:Lipid droplet assembly factor 1 n=1 Tax=Lepisosteus oculatus TaxID=7918 RepID=W5MMX7_LEPOC|nr:PREDICTED: promethin [Lepisosteus oculatus]XP_015215548.1 PREDICTED: promethin [Lepisosteus oculatus]XP_015215549.1 PREDICTED: promethin [Lepisosteus oculatus]XP_015215550.1 PREDICTED: promethin [Lepisosteus oculatus]XP_015215551.1 PREDICTED: promethin [Lepisosteus oculatus]